MSRQSLPEIAAQVAASSSFPGLKHNEIDEFGEYRTQRYVLHAFDQLARGALPDLENQ